MSELANIAKPLPDYTSDDVGPCCEHPSKQRLLCTLPKDHGGTVHGWPSGDRGGVPTFSGQWWDENGDPATDPRETE